jgi:pimeloyl-ACP methyl ester carboxylesterase
MIKLACLSCTLIALLLWDQAAAVAAPVDEGAVECVILLHGLARTDASMEKLAAALNADGYHVENIDYPSREYPVERLAMEYVGRAIESCRRYSPQTIHFVAHSLGGILVRYYLAHRQVEELGRVVMLSPPNHGSEVVDILGQLPGFYALNGPAGQQLGTDDNSLPNRIGPVDYSVGIITGSRSINLILSLLIPGDDDGKVSIERAKLEGMADFLVVPHTHPFIMTSDRVIRQTMEFLQHGRFDRGPE